MRLRSSRTLSLSGRPKEGRTLDRVCFFPPFFLDEMLKEGKAKLMRNWIENTELQKQNSDKFAPPNTDKGQTINAQWPMALSRNRLGKDGAGWARQENTQVMPDASRMAGVDMRLEPGAYRELHWHVAGEWSLVLEGSCRIQAVNENGETFIDDVNAGDVWFFPRGVPHSIQALDGGVEFLLVFDDGGFSEDNTFLASMVFAHQPVSSLFFGRACYS